MKRNITLVVSALVLAVSLQASCSSTGAIVKDQSIMMRQIEMYARLLCRENLTADRLLEKIGTSEERKQSTITFSPIENAFSRGMIRLDPADDAPLSLQLDMADPTEFGYKALAAFFGSSNEKIKSGFDGRFYIPLKNYTFETCQLEVEITLIAEAAPSPETPDPNILTIKMKRLR